MVMEEKFERNLVTYMKLRLLDYLDDISEHNGVAISSKLRCACGNSTFEFFHTGKQTKGILAPYIIRKNKQLILQAKCRSCGKTIEVFNSALDGSRAKEQAGTYEFTAFVLPKSKETEFEVAVKYNYFPDKLKENGEYSNSFENCFIYIVENGKEGKALIED
jgi:hypothetical protein